MSKEMNTNEAIREKVGRRYARIVEDSSRSCCGDNRSESTESEQNCCDDTISRGTLGRGEESRKLGYSEEEMQSVPAGSNLGLGCGNPGAIAAIKPGEIVLDLGSGAGFDCFLAARQLGDTGRVIGVDMTPEMLRKARENAAKQEFSNVEFRLGEIECLPAGDATVDVIMSNCVINLSPEKEKVFGESFRVLKPGGRIAISDIVSNGPLPEAIRQDPEKYCGCIAGAATLDEVKTKLATAGFTDINIELNEASKRFIKDWLPESGVENYVVSANIQAVKSINKNNLQEGTRKMDEKTKKQSGACC